ncbi:MAG: hypothetical protein ABL884_06460 [Methyloglobulus sp.]
MKIEPYKQNPFISVLIGIVVAFSLTACSDEKPKAEQAITQNKATQAETISVDSPHDSTPEAEIPQKQKFEHDFAAQCIDRELNNSTNKIADAERLTKSCECIAAYITKDLTDEEAEKFNSEHEHPQSLRIKFEAAAYECLQEKTQPAEPKLFGKQQ